MSTTGYDLNGSNDAPANGVRFRNEKTLVKWILDQGFEKQGSNNRISE
jgi:hypothetical protein